MKISGGIPSDMPVECPKCDAYVIAKPHGHLIYYNQREGPAERWTLLACLRGHPLLVVQEELAPGMLYEEDKPYRVYPPQDRRLSQLIPSELRNSHEEARKCFHAKSYKGAVAMCGVTLEGACQLNDAKKGTLNAMLKEMKNMGKIDNRLWDWADALRDVRNLAAHFNDETLTRQDADDCLAFSEALLDYLYVLSARFESMQERRSSNKQENSE